MSIVPQVAILTENLPLQVNFHVILSSIFMIRIGIAFILLLISFGRYLLRRLVFYCFDCVVQSLTFALSA